MVLFLANDEAEIALAKVDFLCFYDINKAIPEQVHRIFAASWGYSNNFGCPII